MNGECRYGSILVVVWALMCLGCLVLSGCSSVTRSARESSGAPQVICWPMVVEIHDNCVGDYPKDCLVKGLHRFPIEELRSGDVAIVRTENGGTRLAEVGSSFGFVDGSSYIGKAIGLYDVIGADPIPLSYWPRQGLTRPGETRIMFESFGESMLPRYPRHGLIAGLVGVDFQSLRSSDPVVYHQSSVLLVFHRLVGWSESDRAWTVRGDNLLSNRDPDFAWVTRRNFIALGGGVVRELGVPKPLRVASRL